MKVIPYGRQVIDERDKQAVLRALSGHYLTQGPLVEEFEQALAKVAGARFAVAVSSGTAALHLAYLAAGLSRGDEVITTGNTFAATANMLLAVGARPIFCDIRLDTGNIDERQIPALITPRARAIVPVHFAGIPCEMDAIAALARKRGLLVIADACHALGATYKNRPAAALGDLAVLSFHPVKTITTGEGGAVLTNDKKLAERLKLLRSHGIAKDENGFNVMTELGFNYRLTDIQSALGLSQLKKLPAFIRARATLATSYLKLFAGLPFRCLHVPENATSAWHIFVVQTNEPGDRLPLYRHLKAKGIGVNFHYPPVYSHPYYRAHGFRETALPETEKYAARAITLPLHAALTDAEQRFIVSEVRRYFKKRT